MNWTNYYYQILLLLGLSLVMATGLHLFLRGLIRGMIRRMDISLTYLFLRITVLVYLLPLTGVGETFRWISEGYWGNIHELIYPKLRPLLLILSIVWAVGTVYHFLKCLISLWQVRRGIRMGSTPASVEWIRELEEVCRCCGRKRIPSCRERFGDRSAFLVGILRPTVYVPVGTFTETERRVVLTHEVNHIREHDLFWKMMAAVIRCIFWFSPLTWRLTYDIHNWSEFNCDYASCDQLKSAKLYFEVMTKMITDEPRWGSEVCVAYFGDESREVIRRMSAMVAQKRMTAERVRWILAASAIFLLGSTTTVSAASYSFMMQYRQQYLEGLPVICEESIVMDYPVYGMSEEQAAVLRASGRKPSDWRRDPGNWMIVSVSGEWFYDIAVPAHQVLLFEEFHCPDGGETVLSCDIEPETEIGICGVICPDGSVQYSNLQGVILPSFYAEEEGTYRYFVANTGNRDVRVSGYTMLR